MPSIQVFPCPSCGASLSYDGGPETTLTCMFCGASAPVPAEGRSAAEPRPPAAPSGGGELPEVELNAGNLRAGLPLARLAELKRLAQGGHKIEAIKLYREIFPAVGLKDAKETVEKLAAGQPLVLTGADQAADLGAVETGQGAVINSAALAAVAYLARSGKKIEAIKAYRSLTGVGLSESKEAVEKLEAGQPVTAAALGGEGRRLGQAALAEVAQLAGSGQKLEAVKLYRALSGAGLKEALEAVEAMPDDGSAAPLSSGSVTSARRPARPAPPTRSTPRARGAGLGGAGCGLLLTAAIVGFVLAVVYLPFRLSGSYKQAVAAAQADPSVKDALGAPIRESWLPSGGEISCGGSGCSADYSISIYGSRKGGTIIVTSHSKGWTFFSEGVWTLDAYVRTNDGVIFELGATPGQGMPPQPTAVPMATAAPAPTAAPSAADQDATAGAEARLTQRAAGTATVVARREATATAQAAQATAQAVVSAQTGWPAVVSERFAGNDLGWPTGLLQDDSMALTTTVSASRYEWLLQPYHSSSYWNLMPEKSPELTDFYATVTLQFLEGEVGNGYAYGLVFRQVDRDYGFFGIQNDGQFRVLVVYDSGIYEYYEMNSAAIRTRPRQTNQLTVRAIGSDFVFQINDEVVWQISEDFPAGQIGLGLDVSQRGEPAQVEFSNFEVYAP